MGVIVPTYRSKVHSPLEASPNKYKTDVLSPLDANPIKYRSREHSLLVWGALFDPFLIGWYKHNEGSGAVVHNYATNGSSGGGILPDLTVVNLTGNFWSYLSGFGSSPSDLILSLDSYSYFNYGSEWGNYDGADKACNGGFFRQNFSKRISRYFYSLRDTSGFIVHALNIYENSWTPYNCDLELYRPPNPALTTPANSVNYNNWNFAFYADDRCLHLVKEDGTKVTSLIGGEYSYTWDLQSFYVGIADSTGNYPIGGSFGDIIIYNNKRLTVAEWADWYDQLRSRYGMSARSGW